MTEAPDLIRLNSPDGRLSAWIAPHQGAELCGLEWQGRELLWRGRDFAPTSGWTGRAPILWPAIGRTFAHGPEPTAETFRQAPLGWTVGGVDHPMPMHGFARSLPWAVEDRTPSTLRLALTDDAQTRAFYPFGFRHTLTYSLADGALTLVHQIEAARTNPGAMPFVVGNHATFNLPPGGARNAVDATLISNASHRMVLDAAGRPTGESVPFDAYARPTPARAVEAFDVIVLHTGGEPPRVRLSDPSGLCVTVSHHAADRQFSSLEFVTLWGDPGGGYLSLEAWLGRPNALATGDGACFARPGSAWEWTMSIEVEQHT